MPINLLNAPVGTEQPLKPDRSLPSYDESPPETHRHISREEEAELALNNTRFTPGTRAVLITLFLLTLLAVPALQLATEYRQTHAIAKMPLFDLFKLIPSPAKLQATRTLADVDGLIPRAGEIKAAEKALENESVVSQWLLPRVQSFLTGTLRAGNEQAIPGRDGWLFYRPDVEYLTGPPFLDPARMKARARTAGVQPDPVQAIVAFRNQLARRGIELVVLPAPVKPGIDGEMLSAQAANAAPLQNPSFAEFLARLNREGVRVFDPEPLLRKRKASGPLYLETDTHWRPETMEFVAKELAAFLASNAGPKRQSYHVANQEFAGMGDIAAMLKLPAGQTLYKSQKVTLHQVTSGNALWRQSKDASVLLLGDSFCNIFSLAAMGWGESAGFAEHLSRALGQPLDCILRNSDASFATREILSRELACGRDRLAGKKLVVWEFAARELAFGNWKPLEFNLGAPRPSHFFGPKPGETLTVTGVVESVSPAPRPGSVPYKDHILTVHLVDINGAPHSTGKDTVQSLVYLWSMRDNVWTKAAHVRPGDRITLRLRAWTDVAAQYEKINRSEIADDALLLEEPVWGEWVE